MARTLAQGQGRGHDAGGLNRSGATETLRLLEGCQPQCAVLQAYTAVPGISTRLEIYIKLEALRLPLRGRAFLF